MPTLEEIKKGLPDDEFSEFYSYPYTEKCEKCGTEITVYTQEDDHPEYTTNVFVPCPKCGNLIDFESITYGYKGKHYFYGKMQLAAEVFNRDLTDKTIHHAQRPLELINKCLFNSSLPEQIVLDVFGGSGSTLIACEQTGRVCYMMEIDPRYCEIIAQRWEKYTGQKRKLIENEPSKSD